MLLQILLKKVNIIFLIPVLFLVAGIITISDYGINWDEPLHFNRGHAYLYFFLTGKTNFLELPSYPKLKGASDFMDIRGEESSIYKNATLSILSSSANLTKRSYFQSDIFNFEFFLKNDSGHPPINGILAALFNFIFFQKLGILGDIESHHLFEVIVSAILVLVVTLFSYRNFGMIAGLVSGAALASYPLFFAESHFNIKDPAEAAFFALTIIFFYYSVVRSSTKLLILAGIFFGLALGTKFNALFIFPILFIWLIFYLYLKKESNIEKIRNFFNLLLLGLIGIGVLYIFWPYLWQDPINNISLVISYYRTEGLGIRDDGLRFLVNGWNTLPVLWIIFTTPPFVILLVVCGIYKSLYEILMKKQHIFLLILLWMFVPIIRVSFPNTIIYGGVRQIMEYIPPLALLAGIGVMYVYTLLGRFKTIFVIILILAFFVHLVELTKIHPNQNVYFNFLIGGLSGAKEKNIPSWGNSYGNAYLQAIKWLNQNAGENAKLGLPLGNMVNIPRVILRKDIDFSNEYFSAFARMGEYQIELSHDYPPKKNFTYSYLDKFLEPVYEVKVDGVAIAKVWKNDQAHFKKPFKENNIKPVSIKIHDKELFLDMGKEINITRLVIKHNDSGCDERKGGYVAVSSDKEEWLQLSDPIEYRQMNGFWLGYDKKEFFFLFAGDRARFIKLNTQSENACLLKYREVFVSSLVD